MPALFRPSCSPATNCAPAQNSHIARSVKSSRPSALLFRTPAHAPPGSSGQTMPANSRLQTTTHLHPEPTGTALADAFPRPLLVRHSPLEREESTPASQLLPASCAHPSTHPYPTIPFSHLPRVPSVQRS